MPIEATVLEAMLIDAYRIRSITAYNRLEASPRTMQFDRSLKAEVRDPLWMLTRQWQFGEFTRSSHVQCPFSSGVTASNNACGGVALG